MIDLSSLSSPRKGRPLIITIVADGGMGKTTLGSLFPMPVFVRTEDGTQSIANRDDVALFPVASNTDEVFASVDALIKEDHGFKTVVFDSVTRFNVMVEAEVLAQDPRAKGLNQAHGGYGNAYDLVAKYHGALRERLGILNTVKGMHVVILAHASTETVDPPDSEPFTRYTIPMHKKSLPHWTNDVDVVAYIKQKMYVTGEGDKKKALTDGSRIVACYPTPSHVAKNRLGIKTDLAFVEGQNPFAPYI